MLNKAETAVMSHRDGVSTYLGVGDAKHVVKEMDGVESHADVSTGHEDIPNVKTNVNRPAKAPDSISIPRKWIKPPDLPSQGARTPPDEPNGIRNRMDTFSIRTDAYTVGNRMEMPANKTENIRMRRNGRKTRNSLYTPEITKPEPTYRWKRVSNGDGGVYVPWNVPVRAQGQTFEFGEVESAGGWIMVDIEGETDGDGDRSGDGRGGRMDGTTSGSGVDSTRVNAVLLAIESQHANQT